MRNVWRETDLFHLFDKRQRVSRRKPAGSSLEDDTSVEYSSERILEGWSSKMLVGSIVEKLNLKDGDSRLSTDPREILSKSRTRAQGFRNRRVNEPWEIRFLSVCYTLFMNSVSFLVLTVKKSNFNWKVTAQYFDRYFITNVCMKLKFL